MINVFCLPYHKRPKAQTKGGVGMGMRRPSTCLLTSMWLTNTREYIFFWGGGGWGMQTHLTVSAHVSRLNKKSSQCMLNIIGRGA